MLDCIKFLLDCCITLLNKLFSIDMGFTSLGVLLCIVNILFPAMLMIIGFAKQEALTLFAKEYYDDEKRSKK